jgi:hypothetical protein
MTGVMGIPEGEDKIIIGKKRLLLRFSPPGKS